MEKQKGRKPSIRFSEFKDAWEHKQLNELLSEAKKRNTDLKYGKDEVLSVSGELGIVNQIEHLGRSYAGVSVHQYHVVEVGDIVYTKSPLKANPFGIIKLNKGKAGIVSTLYAVYTVNKATAHGEFLDQYFSLDTNTNRYLRPLVKKGAKNDMKINNAYVLHDRIFAPTLAEQKRIASFLSVLDHKIAQLKQKKSHLEQYKKVAMQKIFSQELRFKDDKGKAFPKWEKKKVIDAVTNKSEKYNPEKETKSYKCIELEHLATGTGKLLGYVDSLNQNSIKNKFEKGDVLFGKLRPYLRKFLQPTFDGVCSSEIWVLKGIGVSNDFLYWLIQTNSFIEVANKSSGSKMPRADWSLIASTYFAFPKLEEQTKIASLLSALDEKINRTETQITQTDQYKKGLLQKMFI